MVTKTEKKKKTSGSRLKMEPILIWVILDNVVTMNSILYMCSVVKKNKTSKQAIHYSLNTKCIFDVINC